MKRTAASLLLIVLPVLWETPIVNAQSPNEKPVRVVNTINIPGTHIFIDPPPGYKISVRFKGMEKDKATFIKVYDPYNNDYTKYAPAFTRETLENNGSEVQDYKRLNISGFPGKYASVENNAGGITSFLVFGDSSFSAMLMASCTANSDSDMQQIKAAFLSVKYNKSLKIDPLSGTFFHVNDSNSAYHFAKCSNDYYVYSSGEALKEEYSGESIVSILPFTSEYSVGDETIAGAINSSYQQYGITDIKIKKQTQVKVGILNAMEAEADARIDNKKAVLYRLTLIDGKRAVLVLGIATSDFDKNMDAFRSLAHTVTFK